MQDYIFKNIDKVQLSAKVLKRFNIKMELVKNVDVRLNAFTNSITEVENDNLKTIKTIKILDLKNNVEVCTFKSEDSDYDIAITIKRSILEYLCLEFKKKGYCINISDMAIAYPSSYLKNVLMFVKEEYKEEDINAMAICVNGDIVSKNSKGEKIILKSGDFVDIGTI